MANGTGRIHDNNIFYRQRPTRSISFIIGQDRFNESHQLQHFKAELPNFEQYIVKINDAIVQPDL